ncbi:A/G-specific adenine glycosylase [Pseudodesulfovibrio profundus]|uniref:Adenine DNA glycosylase n=1 Tax=Pseudodesulfovibrio profundus TaxID=57320 RepID=A0A2C8F4J2_9BACT|nr:A/G-specific adenine glycosylase [Pseudodesulfovibrio profundus]SOB57017.1 A/G-specific adenine glycosylase [Pseudodesulfovibrio profundus]
MDRTFTEHLLQWYDANRRDLPWRSNPEPYGVWISEIMAQQTQMERVVAYWRRWMERYPDLGSLAAASEEEVLKVWEGLGYYSRAKNIRKAAELILTDHAGVFPDEIKQIQALPGIGAYTAGAIASIAFNKVAPAVDANVLRVFARLLDIAEPVKAAKVKQEVEQAVLPLIPEKRPGDFNQALMEFGAMICSKRPDCDQCPMSQHCAAFANGTTGERPVLPRKRKAIHIEMATGVLVYNDKVLIQKRKPDDVWPGLWEFPGGCVEKGETPREALVREYMEEVELEIYPAEKITVVSYSYTKYRVTMHCYLCHSANNGQLKPVFNEAVTGQFVSPESLSSYAFPAGHRRLIECMLDEAWFDNLK